MKDISLAPLLRWCASRRWMAAAILVLLVIGVYSRVVVTRQYEWIWSPDLVDQVYPWLELQADAFHRGEFPLWDPYQWGGQPLLGQVQPGAAYPLNWLLFSLPMRDGFLRYGFLDVYFGVLHLMAALFAYWFARGLGVSRWGAVAAGLIFSLGGYMGRTDWPQMMNSALWTPLVLLAVFRARETTRPWSTAALGGLALAMAWLSGHHQVPIFLSITAGALWLLQATWGGVLRMRIVAAAALFFVVTGLVGAFQILPSLEYGRNAVRWVGGSSPAGWQDTVGYDLHEGLASRPHRVLGVLLPNNFDQYDHYLGFAAFTLAVLGIAAGLRRWDVRALAVISVAAFVLAMGGFTFYHGLLYAFVPLVEKARTPAAFSALMTAAMAVLAGFGLDALRERLAERGRELGLRALATAGVLLLLFGAGLFFTHGGTFPTDDRFLLSATAALLLAGLWAAFGAGQLPGAWLATGTIALMLVELSVSALLPFPTKANPERKGAFQRRYEYRDVADYLRDREGHARAHVRHADISMAFGDLFQVPVYEGYTASVPASVWELGLTTPKTLMLYGVDTYISREPLYDGQTLVRDFGSGVKAWRVESAFPRAWISHRTQSFPDLPSFRAAFDSGALDARESAAFVGEAPSLPACEDAVAAQETVEITDYGMNHAVLRARTGCRGLLVFSDNAFPGWEARVDGEPREILRPYHALRGVLLEPGEHTVEFRYRPTRLWLGVALSATGLLLVGLLLLWERQRSNPASAAAAP